MQAMSRRKFLGSSAATMTGILLGAVPTPRIPTIEMYGGLGLVEMPQPQTDEEYLRDLKTFLALEGFSLEDLEDE